MPLPDEARDLRFLRRELAACVIGSFAGMLACGQQLAFGAPRLRLGLEPLDEDVDHVRGAVGAPVIVEYGDYEWVDRGTFLLSVRTHAPTRARDEAGREGKFVRGLDAGGGGVRYPSRLRAAPA